MAAIAVLYLCAGILPMIQEASAGLTLQYQSVVTGSLLLTAGIVAVFAAGCVVCLLKCREKKAWKECWPNTPSARTGLTGRCAWLWPQTSTARLLTTCWRSSAAATRCWFRATWWTATGRTTAMPCGSWTWRRITPRCSCPSAIMNGSINTGRSSCSGCGTAG